MEIAKDFFALLSEVEELIGADLIQSKLASKLIAKYKSKGTLQSSLDDSKREEEEKIICDATGKEMKEGFVVDDGEMYFKEEKHLVAYLRSLGDEEYNKASDEFILKEAFEDERYYYTEWEE